MLHFSPEIKGDELLRCNRSGQPCTLNALLIEFCNLFHTDHHDGFALFMGGRHNSSYILQSWDCFLDRLNNIFKCVIIIIMKKYRKAAKKHFFVLLHYIWFNQYFVQRLTFQRSSSYSCACNAVSSSSVAASGLAPEQTRSIYPSSKSLATGE